MDRTPGKAGRAGPELGDQKVRILSEALDLFVANGFAATGMRQIAARMDFSVGGAVLPLPIQGRPPPGSHRAAPGQP